jgi:hypothetical protein
MRIAHAHFLHVIQRVADVVDACAALADALRHEARAPVEIELADVGRMLGVGKEGERAHMAPRRQRRAHQARRVYPARHLAVPQVPQGAAHARLLDAEGHSPARAALAKPHDEPRPAVRASVARGQDAQRPVVAVNPGHRLLAVPEARRPDERAVAEDPQVVLGKPREEFVEGHRRRIIESRQWPVARRSLGALPPKS